MVPLYVRRLQSGAQSATGTVTVVSNAPAFLVLDAHHVLGQVSAAHAVALAIGRAREMGVALVVVRRAHHFGAASTWALRIAAAGCLGIAMSNTTPLVAAPGGRKALVGTNPLSIASPTNEGTPLVVDMAMSQAAMATIRRAASAGHTIPDTWAVDIQGRPTADPHEALRGALQPVGGGKGFALALLIDVLTGVLSGGASGSRVKGLFADLDRPNDCAHLFIAIDPALGIGAAAFGAGLELLLADLQVEPSGAATQGARIPGHDRFREAAEQRINGALVDEDIWRELAALADQNASNDHPTTASRT